MTATPALQLLTIDPAELIIDPDRNVRHVTNVKPELVASVREKGVLQPPIVTALPDGTYLVIDGQHRTLAALEARLVSIQVLVAATPADADRVTDQLSLNHHRTNLTEAQDAAAVHQLSLFGLSASQIVKKTALPRARVDAGLAVAKSENATKVLQESQITLLQAAAIAEFDDDPAAVARLTDRALTDPSKFDHAVAAVRAARELDAYIATLEAQLATLPNTYLGIHDAWMKPTSDLHLAKPDFYALAATPSTPLANEDAAALPAAHVYTAIRKGHQNTDTGWREWATTTYWIDTNQLDALGIVKREYISQAERPDNELTPEELAEREARAARNAAWEAEQAARAERRALADAATAVRRAWISQYLDRPTARPATDLLPFVASTLTYSGVLWDDTIPQTILEWLDIPQLPTDEDPTRAKSVNAALNKNPKLATTFILAGAIHAIEEYTDWGGHIYPDFAPTLAAYLLQLRAWGYGLSDHEQIILDNALAASVETDTEESNS